MNRVTRAIDDTEALFYSICLLVAYLVAPVTPAVILGYAVYGDLRTTFSEGWALVLSVILGSCAWVAGMTIGMMVEKFISVSTERAREKAVPTIQAIQPVEPVEPILSSLARKLKVRSDPGFIYLMRRNDGVYKIGKARDIFQRASQHVKDYQSSFEIVAAFYVPDMISFERFALDLTDDMVHREGNRKELRDMHPIQVNLFTRDFGQICIEAMEVDDERN